MIGIIIVGHGNFATGISSSLELIIGKQKNYFAVDFDGIISPDELSKRIEKSIGELSDCENIFIFTDLLGGTPFRQAATATLEHKNVSVFAGTNLPMLIECLMTRDYAEDVTAFANNLVEVSRNQLAKYQEIEETKDDTEDDTEEGI